MKNKTIKIISGELRNRNITFLDDQKGLRPTSSRVRETLFNWLQTSIYNQTCLDLFAGTGALGIEAVSRGAKTVHFIDINQRATQRIKENLERLNITNNAQVFCDSYSNYLQKNTPKFDIIFLDPPFNQGLISKSLQYVIAKNPKYIYIEDNQSLDLLASNFAHFELIRSKKAGHVYYGLLKNSQPRMIDPLDIDTQHSESL